MQPPPISPSPWPPPPSHLLLPQTLAATPPNPSHPHLLLPKVPFLVAWIYVAWCKSPIGFGGGKKEGRKRGESKVVDFRIMLKALSKLPGEDKHLILLLGKEGCSSTTTSLLNKCTTV
ncbi:uncharacterized protein [Zea mays]|uniref:uncharacterized protein n=1 Tax=Zea mays TaxID=4577 RepID=UPI0016529968|nr:uncharacterized protein LOC118473521 [Zea mays]